jgi:hypothetical protein
LRRKEMALRRGSDRRALAVLLTALPSYLPAYEEFASREGENFSVEAFFAEIANEADRLLCRSRDHEAEARLERIAEVLELVATDPRVESAPLLEAFLSALSPAARTRIDGYLRQYSVLVAGGIATEEDRNGRAVSPAVPLRLRPRPRRYSGRAPRRRRRL